ncbi:AAA family ATPase [Cryobacterium shii]|uniref:AAA family ATPase n=1 Tax=Cryobacterium shii TaxID=1259235 RepID=A0AAQ2C709_9MICO|nr:ATP-binding protein [Cryobacterium shii]TFC48897.1 AAA family ATPase [Cryobacterium shii]
MLHFAILKSLIRVALADNSGPARHQVERLIEALRADGETKEAAALVRMLNQGARSHELAPSRISRSASAAGGSQERLTPSVPLPVDKETSAPLATVIFPGDIVPQLPLFPEALKENIEALVLEWENSERIAAAGMRPSLSCLVYGAPGTGKTTLAFWFAARLGIPVVLARLDGLISSYLGTTARNLGALFAFANRYECVLVLDEFDAIAKVRDDPNEVGEIKRVVNALLQNMDAREGRGITIGLTNHESLLDTAIWRRFEVQLAVPLPGFEQRVEIARRSLDADAESTDADAKLLAWVCEGLSGAELQTMALKFRKRRLLLDDIEVSPVTTVAQLSRSTSVHIDPERADRLFLDEVTLTKYFATSEIKFTHGELASLFGRSTKTIGRRISEEGSRHDE